MRDLVSSFMSYCLANSLYAVQETAKLLGAPATMVVAGPRFIPGNNQQQSTKEDPP